MQSRTPNVESKTELFMKPGVTGGDQLRKLASSIHGCMLMLLAQLCSRV